MREELYVNSYLSVLHNSSLIALPVRCRIQNVGINKQTQAYSRTQYILQTRFAEMLCSAATERNSCTCVPRFITSQKLLCLAHSVYVLNGLVVAKSVCNVHSASLTGFICGALETQTSCTKYPLILFRKNPFRYSVYYICWYFSSVRTYFLFFRCLLFLRYRIFRMNTRCTYFAGSWN